MSQAEFKKRLKVLMNLPENQVCSDCPERQPRWASLIVPPPGSPPNSLPIGAFCCLECSGSHRRLGVHISFVRSITLDSWKEKEVMAMENGGNAKVNAIFEARLPDASLKPTTSASGSVRERFIRDKYERRKYFDANVLTNYHEINPVTNLQIPQVSSSNTKTARNPSEAARLRAQARRHVTIPATAAATTMTHSSTNTISKAKPTTSSADEIDLLDFNAPFASDPGSPLKPPSESSPSPTLDMFQNFSSGMQINAPVSSAPNTRQFSHTETQKVKTSDTNRLTSDDIMKMFHTPSLPNQSLSSSQKNEQMDPFANFANFNSLSGQNTSFPMQQTAMHSRNKVMSTQQHAISTNCNMGTNANYSMSMNMNQNNIMSYGNMNQHHMVSNNTNGATSGASNMNFFQNNNGMYAADMQPSPMGGNPLNYQSMGRGGSMNQFGSGATSSFPKNDKSWNGRQLNHQQGTGDAFGDVMGGSSRNTQNQFASFGSFR